MAAAAKRRPRARNSVLTDFGSRLRVVRVARGLALADLADLLAETPYARKVSYLSEIERGAKTPSEDLVAGLIDVLDLGSDEAALLREARDQEARKVSLKVANKAVAATVEEIAELLSDLEWSEIEEARGAIRDVITAAKARRAAGRGDPAGD